MPGRPLVAGLSFALLLGALVTGDAHAAGPPGTGDLLDAPRHGQDAVTRLGAAGLRTAAARNRTGAGDLAAQLREDPTLWVDRQGHLLVKDTGLVNPSAADLNAPDADRPPSAPARLATAAQVSSAFSLHSRSGSDRVVFLDFDGHRVVGTGWNDEENGTDFTAEPFDTDRSPSTFSTSELAVVQEVWARVSEDYAVFDVDVTTQDPGTAAIDRSGMSDTAFGTRAVITNTTKVFSSCHCGGVAYLDVFDYPYGHEQYQPAFVFQRGVGAEAKDIAEAVSHEVGHNLALHHDGNASTEYYEGQGAWAPIMGAAYGRPISQWSAGEYSGASNTEDDLALITSSGLNHLADDHGDTAASATVLGGPAVSVAGVITTRSDVDRFAFTTVGGLLSLSVSPSAVGPDLDASLSLYDADGTLLARDDPASAMVDAATATGLDAALTRTVAAGTYTVAVDGVGAGSPSGTGYSDFASIGRYTLSGTLPEGTPAVPTAPADVRASVRSGRVTVRWTDRATTESRYQMVRQRQYPNGTWSPSLLVSTRPAGATSASNSPWAAGRYRFLVRATSPYGSSAWVMSNAVRR